MPTSDAPCLAYDYLANGAITNSNSKVMFDLMQNKLSGGHEGYMVVMSGIKGECGLYVGYVPN